MKKIKFKLVILSLVLFASNVISAQSSQIIRVLNINNTSQTYQYTINFDISNNATINRIIVPALPSDDFGVNIVGNGWSLNTNILALPPSPNNNWYEIDVNFTGSQNIINTASITIYCPCASINGVGNCEAKSDSNNCVKCFATQTCSTCGQPTVQTDISNTAKCPIIINANSVTFNY